MKVGCIGCCLLLEFVSGCAIANDRGLWRPQRIGERDPSPPTICTLLLD